MLEARLPTASASAWRLNSPESCTRVQCFVIYHAYASTKCRQHKYSWRETEYVVYSSATVALTEMTSMLCLPHDHLGSSLRRSLRPTPLRASYLSQSGHYEKQHASQRVRHNTKPRHPLPLLILHIQTLPCPPHGSLTPISAAILSQNSAISTSLILSPSGLCVVHSTVTLLYRFDHSGWCLCTLHS